MDRIRRLRKTLRRVAVRIGIQKAAIRDLQDEIQHYAARAARADEVADKAHHKARQQRRRHHPARAAFWEAREARARARAHNRQDRAQKPIPELKRHVREKQNLEDVREQLAREIKEYERTHGPQLKGDTASGGDAVQRVRLVALTAAARDAQGKRPSFYDWDGYFTAHYAVTGEPRSARSDCSQWSISVSRSCGLPDPAGGGFNDGNTASIVANCHQISESEMKRIGVGFVVYGPGGGFHMEVYTGPGDDTVGHGSAPVDKGSIHMIGGTVRFYRIPGT